MQDCGASSHIHKKSLDKRCKDVVHSAILTEKTLGQKLDCGASSHTHKEDFGSNIHGCGAEDEDSEDEDLAQVEARRGSGSAASTSGQALVRLPCTLYFLHCLCQASPVSLFGKASCKNAFESNFTYHTCSQTRLRGPCLQKGAA